MSSRRKSQSGSLSRSRAWAIIAVAGIVATGCGPGGDSTASQPLPACPADKPTRIELLWSDSADQRSAAIQNARLAVTRHEALLAAACKASFDVVLVAEQASPVSLYSGRPRQSAGTAVAVSRRSTNYVDKTVMPEVTANVQAAMAHPPVTVSSPSGLFQILADHNATSAGTSNAVLLADFVQHDASINLNRPVSVAQASALAAKPAVPSLAGTTIAIYGAGATRDPVAAPDGWIRAVNAYARQLCQRTRATGCIVTTQYPTGRP